MQSGVTVSPHPGASLTRQATCQAAGHCCWWHPKSHTQLKTMTLYSMFSFKSGYTDHPAHPQRSNSHSTAALLSNPVAKLSSVLEWSSLNINSFAKYACRKNPEIQWKDMHFPIYTAWQDMYPFSLAPVRIDEYIQGNSDCKQFSTGKLRDGWGGSGTTSVMCLSPQNNCTRWITELHQPCAVPWEWKAFSTYFLITVTEHMYQNFVFDYLFARNCPPENINVHFMKHIYLFQS